MSDYYVQHKKRCLWEFDFVAKSARPVLERYFAGESVPALLAEARREFENLLLQLPYIGEEQPFAEFLVFTGMFLAIHRVNQKRGRTVEQTGELVFEIGRVFLKSAPTFFLRVFTPLNFTQRSWERLRQSAIKSHARQYPEGYVFDFVPGDGKTFDYGVDYRECASCKFLVWQGIPELAPYLCPVDILYSEALGWGLMRTQTLAQGADKCDFRFKQGGLTKVAVPEAWSPSWHRAGSLKKGPNR